MDTDWTSILWNKINWLQTVGLVPWYAYGQTPAASLPETSANSSSGWADLLPAWQRRPCLNGAAASCTCLLAVVALLQGSIAELAQGDAYDSTGFSLSIIRACCMHSGCFLRHLLTGPGATSGALPAALISTRQAEPLPIKEICHILAATGR